MNELRFMLKELSKILEKHAQISKATSGDFNIFKIADISTDERIMCRILYELLNPEGSHGQGNVYLEFFLKNVLKITEPLKNARVAREFYANGKFIDLVIELPNLFIPIEVKIWAGDQDKQLYDYYNYAKTKNKNNKTIVYYITADGSEPSEESKHKLINNSICLLSWKDDIKDWIESCISIPQTIILAPIREILLQFKQAILYFTGQTEDKVMKEIVEMLSRSSENIFAARILPEALIQCRRNIITDFLFEVNKKLEANKFVRYDTQNELPNPQNIRERKNGMEWPGLMYKTGINIPEHNVEIVLGIEIDSCLYIGFWIFRKGECLHDKTIAADSEVLSNFDETVQNSNSRTSCGPYWEYIIYDNDKIDFWNQNKNYCKLFDKDTFDEIADKTTEQVIQMVKKLNGFKK